MHLETLKMQTITHHPLASLVAFLLLVALAFVIDVLGLRVWMSWLNRRRGKPRNKDNGSKEYWRVHL